MMSGLSLRPPPSLISGTMGLKSDLDAIIRSVQGDAAGVITVTMFIG